MVTILTLPPQIATTVRYHLLSSITTDTAAAAAAAVDAWTAADAHTITQSRLSVWLSHDSSLVDHRSRLSAPVQAAFFSNLRGTVLISSSRNPGNCASHSGTRPFNSTRPLNKVSVLGRNPNLHAGQPKSTSASELLTSGTAVSWGALTLRLDS